MSLGLLPSAEGGYQVAVDALRDDEGWLHIHGNVKVEEKEDWANWVARVCMSYRAGFGAVIRHLERVKSFAPKVDHLVVDIFLGKAGRVEDATDGLIVGEVVRDGVVLEECQPPSCKLGEGGDIDQEWMRKLEGDVMSDMFAGEGDDFGDVEEVDNSHVEENDEEGRY